MRKLPAARLQRASSRDSTDAGREIALAVTPVKLFDGMLPEEALARRRVPVAPWPRCATF